MFTLCLPRRGIKSKNPSVYWGFNVLDVIPLGFEPRTPTLKV